MSNLSLFCQRNALSIRTKILFFDQKSSVVKVQQLLNEEQSLEKFKLRFLKSEKLDGHLT